MVVRVRLRYMAVVVVVLEQLVVMLRRLAVWVEMV